MDYESYLANLNENLKTKSVDELENKLLISEVASGRVKFLSVVESLQEVLTNENVGIRERGIEFLSWILTQIPGSLFNFSEISVIVNFYCDCLKGHHNFLPATIKGILAIVKMEQILEEEFLKILMHLFQNVNCTTQLQPDRFNIYSILKITVVNHLDVVKQMGPDFVFGLISFIEGESDPKCLFLIFNFLPLFIKEFDLGHLCEELFEVLTCYFPIDFNAAAKDDTVITREDLAEGLHQCLSGTESFCKQCLPLIFQKLDSNFKTAKLDSYKLLQLCCQRLRVESLEKHITEFWKLVQKDVLPGSDKEICEAGLAALTDVICLLSQEETHKNILLEFLNNIIECVKSLADRVDDKMFQPAMAVLLAASAQSKIATNKILVFLKPFYQSVDSKTAMELKIILSSLLPLLKSCHQYGMVQSDDQEQFLLYTDLVNLYINSARFNDYEVRKLAFAGISQVISDFSEDSRKKLYEIIIYNIKTKEDIRTSEEFLSILRQLAHHHSKELQEALFSDMQFSADQVVPYTAGFLWALSLLADIPQFTEFTIPVFLGFIDSNPQYVLGLENLLNACRFAKKNDPVNFYHQIQKEHAILERLMHWWYKFTSSGSQLEEKSLLVFSESIALITRNQNLEEQQTIVNNFLPMFVKDLLSSDGGGDFNSSIVNFQIDSSVENAHAMVVLEAILGSLLPEVTIPGIESFGEKLISIALTSTQHSTRLSSSRLLASLVNKLEENSASNLLTRIVQSISQQLDSPLISSLKCNCGVLFTWTIKGVILRGKPSFEECILKWFDLLGREDVGEVMAENFQTVLEEDQLYLNLDSHCNVRVLYRQRLFGYFPKLLKKYETSQPSVKMNYLLALARLFRGIPKHLIQAEVSDVVIILIQCLNTDKPEVLLTSLEILEELLETREIILGDHIGSFVPKFLELAKFDGHMKIRMKALKCLFFYGFYPTYLLLPLKSRVIHGLELCLDDKKRLVRKEAVSARCRWFLVGAPGEDILKQSS